MRNNPLTNHPTLTPAQVAEGQERDALTTAVNTAVMELPQGTPVDDLLDAVWQQLGPLDDEREAEARKIIARMT